ncbi:MAG: gamma carbonic anhydrase family protein [Candidatus Cloacimonetes bacterium]|nr:gamma carbonic anhydrase family protein [Candidatus Cloacimonadota bacterium]
MISNFKDISPKLGKNVWIAPSADVIGRCEIGEDCSIWFNAVVRGDVHFIKIGKRTNVQDLAMLHVNQYQKEDMSDGNPLIIGNDVTIGHKAMLHGCTIEDACLIGMSATILDGAVIGKESIVAAGSVVTMNKKFPPRSVIMGIPAKIVRQLTDEEIKALYESANHYVGYKEDYR